MKYVNYLSLVNGGISLRCSFKAKSQSVFVHPKLFKAIWFECDLLTSYIC